LIIQKSLKNKCQEMLRNVFTTKSMLRADLGKYKFFAESLLLIFFFTSLYIQKVKFS